MPQIPESAGACRSWKNALLPQLMALDHSEENLVRSWLAQAFAARSDAEVCELEDSAGFQSIFESAEISGVTLKGRLLLNAGSQEFDVDKLYGGILSSVELFQIPGPEAKSINSLKRQGAVFVEPITE